MPKVATRPAAVAAEPAQWGELVNQLAQQLASTQRMLAASQQKAVSTSRSLEARTQELVEARAAVSLLMATLDASADGLFAVGYFGRAMHYNRRFVEMWGIGEDKLAGLNEEALLAVQLAQVRDPQRFLALMKARAAHPDQRHFGNVELADGRFFECHVSPQWVSGRRVGTVTRFRDLTHA